MPRRAGMNRYARVVDHGGQAGLSPDVQYPPYPSSQDVRMAIQPTTRMADQIDTELDSVVRYATRQHP